MNINGSPNEYQWISINEFNDGPSMNMVPFLWFPFFGPFFGPHWAAFGPHGKPRRRFGTLHIGTEPPRQSTISLGPLHIFYRIPFWSSRICHEQTMTSHKNYYIHQGFCLGKTKNAGGHQRKKPCFWSPNISGVIVGQKQIMNFIFKITSVPVVGPSRQPSVLVVGPSRQPSVPVVGLQKTTKQTVCGTMNTHKNS